jgi:transcriptional regulator with XRE-family HTH domain
MLYYVILCCYVQLDVKPQSLKELDIWRRKMLPKDRKLAQMLGHAIAMERQKLGMTQSALAEMIGVEQETISRFERGATIPTLVRLNDIANALCCPLDSLIRSGSTRTEDVSQKIADSIRSLSPEDRAVVGNIIDWLCQRLDVRKSS